MSFRYLTDWFHLDDDRRLMAKPPSAPRTVVGFMMLGALGRERSTFPLLPDTRCPPLKAFGLNPVAPGAGGGTT